MLSRDSSVKETGVDSEWRHIHGERSWYFSRGRCAWICCSCAGCEPKRPRGSRYTGWHVLRSSRATKERSWCHRGETVDASPGAEGTAFDELLSLTHCMDLTLSARSRSSAPEWRVSDARGTSHRPRCVRWAPLTPPLPSFRSPPAFPCLSWCTRVLCAGLSLLTSLRSYSLALFRLLVYALGQHTYHSGPITGQSDDRITGQRDMRRMTDGWCIVRTWT